LGKQTGTHVYFV